MKKKNGFTMVEILGVVILVAAISLLVFPAMLEQFRKAKDDINESTLNLIYSGANMLMDDNLDSYQKRSGAIYCITLRSLVEEGYVSDSIKDVINDRDFDLDLVSVKATYVNNKFEYDFIEDGSCSEKVPYMTFKQIMNGSDEVAALDPDGNLRYVGPTPNNYVSFNGELWRIIGVFNGQTKIIRNDYYVLNDSTSIQWDSNGSNNWATASLNLLWNDENNETSYINTIEKNDPTSYGYIDLEHIWNIGGTPNYSSSTRSDFYTAERSNTPAGASGSEATGIGAIGLMYPSDYGYASGGSTETCEGEEMYDWSEGDYQTECAEKSWLYDNNNTQWTITPRSDDSDFAFVVVYPGFVYGYDVRSNCAARPVLYLKSNVVIVDGMGTIDDPYILAQ